MIIWFAGKIKYKIRKIKLQKHVKEYLNNLTTNEKALIREFYLQGKNDITLKINDDIVVSLMTNGIIEQSGTTLEPSMLFGYLCQYRLTKYARNLISSELINFPVNPTRSDIKQLLQERPKFIQKIIERENLYFH